MCRTVTQCAGKVTPATSVTSYSGRMLIFGERFEVPRPSKCVSEPSVQGRFRKTVRKCKCPPAEPRHAPSPYLKAGTCARAVLFDGRVWQYWCCGRFDVSIPQFGEENLDSLVECSVHKKFFVALVRLPLSDPRQQVDAVS